jgi:hypothetical protein
VRLSLEALEGRHCPSTIILTMDLSVAYHANRSVTFSGQVTDTPSPGGLTVQISGAATGTTTTDASGNYSVTLTATSLGVVQARTGDGLSNIATATLTAGTPDIQNFGYVKGDNNYYTFSGQVTGDVTQGMVVTFSGQSQAMQGKTCTVGVNGWFSITVQIPPSDLGTVSAVATDWWGIPSDVVSVLVTN